MEIWEFLVSYSVWIFKQLEITFCAKCVGRTLWFWQSIESLNTIRPHRRWASRMDGKTVNTVYHHCDDVCVNQSTDYIDNEPTKLITHDTRTHTQTCKEWNETRNSKQRIIAFIIRTFWAVEFQFALHIQTWKPCHSGKVLDKGIFSSFGFVWKREKKRKFIKFRRHTVHSLLSILIRKPHFTWITIEPK